MLGESYRSIRLKNANGQEGQGNLVFSFLIATALISSIPRVKESLDPIRNNVKSFVVSKFDAVRQQANKPADCVMVALSHSPPVGCVNEKK